MLKDNLTEDRIRTASGHELLALVNKYVLELPLPSPQPVGLSVDESRSLVALSFSLNLDMTYCFREVIPAMRKRGWYLQLEDCSSEVRIYFDTNGGLHCGPAVDVIRDESEATGVLRAALLAVLTEQG